VFTHPVIRGLGVVIVDADRSDISRAFVEQVATSPGLSIVCPLLAAGSTSRRNTGVKFLCRGFKSQGLAWPLIELAGHFVEMGLRVHRQVGSFRKILSQQAIGVLVGTALPWTLRIAKVNIDVGR